MAKPDQPSTSSKDLALSSRTMKALGLEQQPFSTAILSDKTIYTDSILNKQYETLKHHLQFSDLILIVEGIFGSGKTTLFRRLFQLDVASLYLMPIHAEATDTLIQIQQKMTIHMQQQGNANYLDDNLKNLQVFDQTPVLIIDDAHVLSDTTLQELLRYKQQLAAENDTHLKLLLLASKGMAKTLEHISDLEHSQFYVQEMPKFNTKQILAFIAHRLKLSGAESLPQLDESSVKKLARKTDGIPAQVLSAAAHLINNLSGKNSAFSLFPSRPALLGLALATLLAAAGWILYPVFSPKMADLSSLFALDMQSLIEPDEAVLVDSDSDHISPADDEDNHNTLSLSDIEADFGDFAEQSEALEAIQPLPVPQAEPRVQPKQEAKQEAPKPVAVKPPKAPTPLPSTKPAPTVQPKPVYKPLTTKQTENPALQTLARMGIKNQHWLLQQNKNHWTLQVLGAREPQTLVNFVRTHNLGQDTAWFRTSLKGGDWYVLVHRFYSDRDIARNSISRLPASLRQARPWVRSIDSIHKAVN
ncbi:MAG: AAA family ATPase [Gammaproteobacteria bacterium]